MSTEPTWKVYLPEWLIVYTAGVSGTEGRDECRRHFDGRYQGRMRSEDWRLVNTQYPQLQVRLPNLHGEFKDYSDAVALASELVDDRGGTAHVVQRGSAEEKALLDYSRKMLPDAG
jgi:hypothetical protein